MPVGRPTRSTVRDQAGGRPTPEKAAEGEASDEEEEAEGVQAQGEEEDCPKLPLLLLLPSATSNSRNLALFLSPSALGWFPPPGVARQGVCQEVGMDGICPQTPRNATHLRPVHLPLELLAPPLGWTLRSPRLLKATAGLQHPRTQIPPCPAWAGHYYPPAKDRQVDPLATTSACSL